ncbi:MAG: YdiU family protein [Sphingomonadales bacterium]|nr:YdiU family protein [Sphingomonadales bacterium]
MIRTPQPGILRPARDILEIADFIGDPVTGAEFPETKVRFRNDRWAETVGLSALDDAQWASHFGRFAPLPGSLETPLALRYHGHQFRNYNPEIGDGRGFLFAQLRDGDGRLLDLGTKGSGQTPWSRFGDGRLTLKGAVREILATEMLEALGVNTSKTFSVIETGEALHRGDEPSPTRSAVLFRLSHGHIRIGSFQRLATLGDDTNLARLTDYALAHYYDAPGGDDAPVRLLSHVTERTADLAASYMVAGFVHGVLNSDNINISGESFDYGPWRFAQVFDPGFTAAYFDEAGLYAFGRQAEAIHWDVVQLAIALSRIADQEALVEALNRFADLYREALVRRMLWRLGVAPEGAENDSALVQSIEAALIASRVGIDRFFFDWQGGSRRAASPADPAYTEESFADVRQRLAGYQSARPLGHPYWAGEAPVSMSIETVENLWAHIAERDDWGPLYAHIEAVRTMGQAMVEPDDISFDHLRHSRAGGNP